MVVAHQSGENPGPKAQTSRITLYLKYKLTCTYVGHPLGPSAWSPVVVDFCSGGGHLGILVAHLLPRATVCLVENKEESLRRAVERVEAMGE